MIGFYDYTVVLTYISLAITMFGMTQATHGHFKIAVLCLALSGICDMFDGKIARSKKNRTDDEKAFGIQIDSLCDMVCFGAFPALICYLLGVRGPIGIAIIAMYCVNSVIRLAYFNVMEAKGALVTETGEKFYRGLPITSIAVVLPLTFMVQFFITDSAFRVLLHVVLLVVGLLFVLNFKLKKPNNKQLAVLISVVVIAVTIMVVYTKYRISMHPLWP